METTKPTPKFQLFQQVRCGQHIYTIIGIEYYSPLRAILEATEEHGFEYRVTAYHGKPLEELVPRCPTQDNFTDSFWESELSAIEEATPCHS